MSDDVPVQQPPSPDLGGEHAYRRKLADGGRVHIDRPLPFLLLAGHPDEPFSLARRVASISAASVIWPQAGGELAEAGAAAEVTRLLDHLGDAYPKFLVIVLHDLPRDLSLHEESPRLEPFQFVLAASRDRAAQDVEETLESALAQLEIDLRVPEFRTESLPPLSHALAAALDGREGISVLSLGIPQIHRIPGDARRIYPQIYHQVESAIHDALLQAAAHFVELAAHEGDVGKRPHHRSLGRRRFVKAAKRADEALANISASFDFLLGVSPINTVEAYEVFEAGQRRKAPEFHYRPLPINPDIVKRRLYAIDLRAVEDPVLEQLFDEKRHELDQQLMMLQRRNTPAFRHVSLLQYGGVEAELLEVANTLLAAFAPGSERSGEYVDAAGVQAAAERILARYVQRAPAFADAETCLRADTGPGLMVSGRSLLISTATSVPNARVDPLLQHEISVHVLTYINGSQQGLGIFGAGLAGYEGLQEGLGVFAEFIVGGLSVARLRLLAARVLVVHAMLDGADFITCHRLLQADHGFSSRGAFNIVARIFRAGGLTKDAIYLRGFRQVLRRVADGLSLDPLWYGKIAEHHVPVVEELEARGMLRPPVATPEFLDRPDAQARLARLREGHSFIDLLKEPSPC
ncbi:MAG: flavohemoglobin expression-modulating QEGLA motif protein [Stenotrophomonas sp.]